MNTGTESPVTDSDMWWQYTTGDALRNGNMATSSLAAKGYRSVRPNLQDKKSPTPAYPGPALPSCLHPNRPRFSTDYTCSQASEHHLHPHSYGLAYSNLDLYPALSGCSSRAQSVSSIAMLEELRTCGIDSEGASESPSPTHCQLSSSTDNMAIDIAIASTANVTIPHGLDLRTALCSVLQFCSVFTVNFTAFICSDSPFLKLHLVDLSVDQHVAVSNILNIITFFDSL